MKKFLIIVILVVGLISFSMNFSGGLKGAGAIGGEPSGAYGRFNVADYQFIDATAAWSYWYNYITITGNYNLVQNWNEDLYYRYGLGATVGLGNIISVSARLPIGVEYDLSNLIDFPINIFADIAPGVSILPSVGFYIAGGAGFVYFF